jgi:type II secretory pathway pseudopilin PulG
MTDMRKPNSKSRICAGPRRGFTLPGLLLGLTSAGLLVMLFIPLYRNAKNTATLRATMMDIEMWSRAIGRYAIDHGAAPTNPNGRITYKKPILRELLPYLERVRITDLWGFSYWIWTGPGIDEFGIRTTGPEDFLIVSMGKKERRESWTFDPRRPQAGFFEIRHEEDFNKDVVLWNGRFVRGPKQP